MANRDIKNNIKQDIIFNGSIATDTLTDCVVLDMQGYNAGVMVALSASNYIDGSYSLSIEDSEDNVTFTAIALDKVIGDYTDTVTTANSLGDLATVGCFSTNRYLKVIITSTATSTAASTAASTATTTGADLVVIASRKGDNLPV